ncbi:MAG: Ig-like domain repeat protein, partial [Leucobacter sp.]|nr:Ig-like domain repeat protein [Leucobacter sp.]
MSTLAKKSGPIGARALAIITSLLVALSGLLVVPAAHAADAPSITVTPAENLDPSVENVLTVTGTGFVGDGAAFGAYVLVGPESVWQGGGPLVSDGWLDQAYVPAAAIASGNFTTTVKIPANTLDPAVTYHVATSAAHQLSGRDRTMDSFFPVTVAQPVVAPTATTTTLQASAAAVETGAAVTLSAGVAPSDAAGTVTFSDNGTQIGKPQAVVAGAASLEAAGLTAGDHSFTAAFAPADPAAFVGSVSAAAVVAVTDKQPTLPESPKAKVAASVSAASKTGLTVAVAAEEIVMRAADATPSGRPDAGAYIGIIDKKLIENYKTDSSAGVFEDFIPVAAIRDGKVTRAIEIPAADLKRGTEYVAVMWRAHGYLNDDRFLGQADIAITPAQWDAVFGAPKATVSASVADASADGLRVSATIENIVLRAAADVPDTGKDDQGVYVGIIEKDRVKEYGSRSDAGAKEDFAYKMFIKDGKVTRSLDVPAAKLDRSKEYVAV